MALYRNIGGVGSGGFLKSLNRASIGASGPPYGRYIFIKNINGLYVSSQQGTSYMTCNTANPGVYEAFLVIDAGGAVLLMGSNGKWVTRQDAEGTPMICNRSEALGWQRFAWIDNGDGTFSLQGDNGLFVSSENGQAPMTCTRSSIGGWEEFTYELLPSDYSFDWIFGSSFPQTLQEVQSIMQSVPAPVPEAPLLQPPPAIPVTADPGTPSLPGTTPTTPTVPTTPTSLPVTQAIEWLPLLTLAGATLIMLTGDEIIHHRPKLVFAGGVGLLYYLLNRSAKT